ncbi:MAG: hypothetical protein WBM43_09360 [Flavobacteriaceae bacterium]
MEFIAHRINRVSDLQELSVDFGVEIDLRDHPNGHIHIAHDPFEEGESFEDYLKAYRHGTMILNVKSERIEFKILELLKKYAIKEYFFLDSSFPMIHTLVSRGERNIALRFSEFEGIDTPRNMMGKINWIWVDCFTKLPIDFERYSELKEMGYKICLVSPELQGRDDDIEQYKGYLQNNQIVFDAICTKAYNIKRWL